MTDDIKKVEDLLIQKPQPKNNDIKQSQYRSLALVIHHPEIEKIISILDKIKHSTDEE